MQVMICKREILPAFEQAQMLTAAQSSDANVTELSGEEYSDISVVQVERERKGRREEKEKERGNGGGREGKGR